MYAIGYDIGSSSIKAALVDLVDNKPVHIVQYPESEMAIQSPQPGWAEQDPETWWDNLKQATRLLLESRDQQTKDLIKGIGISYQMHGLVLLDAQRNVLRPSIIWCDSRAIDVGDVVSEKIGEETCIKHLLNLPGNFTASKFGWVYQNEPEIYEKVDKLILPGDYVNFKLTDEINTTISGLSEGTLWDFKENQPADFLYKELGIKTSMIPKRVGTFSIQGNVSKTAAKELQIPAGIPVCYRAGDQPNNAMSLGVLEAGEVAATGGTSGVVYGVVDQLVNDTLSRVNSFAHVNYSAQETRIGVLLCINAAGSLYRWIRQVLGEAHTYDQMEEMASSAPLGSDGLLVVPFGNGAERMLENKTPGASLINIDLNRHNKAHICRAALEGIAFSFVYGMQMMAGIGVNVSKIKVGNDNLFKSRVLSSTISTLMNCEIEMLEATGAIGAARAVSFTLGIERDLKKVMSNNDKVRSTQPHISEADMLAAHYSKWRHQLQHQLKR